MTNAIDRGTTTPVPPMPAANAAVAAGVATAGGRSPAVAARDVGAPQPPALDPPPVLSVGDTLRATVVAARHRDVILASGALRFLATTTIPLSIGGRHEFVVNQARPQLLLALVPPTVPPSLALARASGLLGAGTDDWLTPAAELFPATDVEPRPGSSDGLPGFATATAELRSGGGSAAALLALHRGLGHQLEAEVLRLLWSDRGAQRRVAELANTAKARALAVVGAPGGPSVVRDAAQALVSGLDRIEADNATRATAQLPLWLPLPAAPDHGLLDARWFVVPQPRDEDRGADGASGARPFTIVLLLSLSRLGELRVDVTLRGGQLHAAFTVVSGDTAARLLPGLGSLQQQLEADGIAVDGLSVRSAARGRLPVADLLCIPEHRGTDALVDLHA